MKLFKLIFLAAISTLLLSSCVKRIGPDGTFGTYSVTCDKMLSTTSGSGIIYTTMHNAVVNLKLDYRTAANDKKVTETTDRIYEENKNKASDAMTLSVMFTASSDFDKPGSKPVLIKKYTFTPKN
jgi:hypothetical protein